MLPIQTTIADNPIYYLTKHEQTLWIARQTGLYRSADAGKTWDNVYQASLPDPQIATFSLLRLPNQAIIAGVNGGIVLSEDAGATWSSHYFRNPAPLVTCLALTPDETLLAGTYEDGVFHSTDAGYQWQAFNFGLLDLNILSIAVSPNFVIDQTVFVGTSTGVFKSRNRGKLWQDISLEIDSMAVLSLAMSPNFPDDGVVYLGTEAKGLWQFNDTNQTWSRLDVPDGAVNTILVNADTTYLNIDDSLVVLNADAAPQTYIADGVHAIGQSDDSTLLVSMNDGTLEIIE